MTWAGSRGILTHLGTLHGSGDLSIGEAAETLGPVTYEIDGYQERNMATANGLIQGDAGMLRRAFDAGTARLALADGAVVEVVLADPKGDDAAEVRLRGAMPAFRGPVH